MYKRQLFGVDPKTVTRWAKAGKLTSIRTLGGHRRYRKSEVDDLRANYFKAQKEPVPYLGGVAIAIGIVAASYGSLLAVDFSMDTLKLASFVLVPAIAISAMGLWDDLKGLEPWPRLVAQTFTGIIVAVILTVTDTMGFAFNNHLLNYSILSLIHI